MNPELFSTEFGQREEAMSSSPNKSIYYWRKILPTENNCLLSGGRMFFIDTNQFYRSKVWTPLSWLSPTSKSTKLQSKEEEPSELTVESTSTNLLHPTLKSSWLKRKKLLPRLQKRLLLPPLKFNKIGLLIVNEMNKSIF